MAVKGGIEIIKALARKLITRDQTGIKRIPTRMEAESEAGAIAAQIQQHTFNEIHNFYNCFKNQQMYHQRLNQKSIKQLTRVH